MRRLTLLLLLLCLPAAAQTHELYLPPTPKPMTVQDVIKLAKAGLSDATILEQLRAKNPRFDLTTDQLLQLKTAGVSEPVIQAMINPALRSAAGPPAPRTNPAPAPAVPSVVPASVASTPELPMPTEIGVYYKRKGVWTELPPEVVNWKTGGVVKSVATVGVVKGDLNGHVNGGHSPNRLATPIQLLVIVPEGTAITEYQLLRLHEHGSYREFRTVTGGVFHVSGGATRDLVDFEGKKVAPRSYEVSLAPAQGQFGLLPPGAILATNAASSAGKIYSFGVIE